MRFLSKILSSSWSPVFRLDYDPIGAGLIANYHKIWSNSPLERRKHTEEETDQIHFNRRDLEPNLRVNQVSSVNQSFFLR